MRTKLRSAVALVVLVGTLLAVGCAPGGLGDVPPNVVVVLIDDLSAELVETMPNTTRLQRDGAYFPNAFVADSLCCSSRASFLTGRYPHNTGVLTNTPPYGGWQVFQDGGNGTKTFPYAMNTRADDPYRTSLQGKFLNGYQVVRGQRVPPGWTQWNPIARGGYRGWNFVMAGERTHGGRVLGEPREYRSLRDDGYVTHVLTRRAERFVSENEREHGDSPYFLQVAPFATHSAEGKRAHRGDSMFPPALRDRPRGGDGGNCGSVDCADLDAADLPGFDDPTEDNRPRFDDGSVAPRWQSNDPMSERDRRLATARFRDRARMAQAVDRMVGRLRDAIGPNTYLVVTSDNGFHLGQHRSRVGKTTAYDYDIRVPLIVYRKADHEDDELEPGPRPQVVSNVDLAATFLELGHTPPDEEHDGVSLVDALEDPDAAGPRYTFVEHTSPPRKPSKSAFWDPDHEGTHPSRVPSYQAVRSKDALLVRYRIGDRHAWEYYRYQPGARDGTFEKVNTYLRDRDTAQVKEMKAALTAFADCAATSCRHARRIS